MSIALDITESADVFTTVVNVTRVKEIGKNVTFEYFLKSSNHYFETINAIY